MHIKLGNQVAKISKKMKDTLSVTDMAVRLLNNILPTWIENLEFMVMIIDTSAISSKRVEQSTKLPKTQQKEIKRDMGRLENQ